MKLQSLQRRESEFVPVDLTLPAGTSEGLAAHLRELFESRPFGFEEDSQLHVITGAMEKEITDEEIMSFATEDFLSSQMKEICYGLYNPISRPHLAHFCRHELSSFQITLIVDLIIQGWPLAIVDILANSKMNNLTMIVFRDRWKERKAKATNNDWVEDFRAEVALFILEK